MSLNTDTLYVPYATWKSIAQANNFTVYEQILDATSRHVWCGTRDVLYRSDVAAANYTDYNTAFPAGPGRVAVVEEPEVLALVIGLAVVLTPRAPDGTPRVSSQNLTMGRESFKRVDNGTEIMNIDGQAGGSPVNVWNGTGGSDAGADWSRSGVGSEATAADAGGGTNGLDTGVTAQNDTFTFDNGSMIDVASLYDDLTFQLQPKAYPIGSRVRCAFLDASNAVVGNWVRIDQQVPNMDLDVWQTVTIDIAQFGLTGDAQKLRFQVRTTSGQQYYLDDVGLVASAGGGPYRFRAAAPAGERWHMSMLVLKVSGIATGWDDTAFATVAGGITHGLVLRHRRVSEGEVLWKFITRDNDELGGFYHPQDAITWANGVMTMGFMIKPGKASVIVTDDDVLEFIVRDDLTGIAKMRAYLHYGVEEVA